MRKAPFSIIAITVITLTLNLFAAPPIPIEPPSEPGDGKPWTKQQVEDARASGNLFKPATELWRDTEFQLDLFGSATAAELSADDIENADAGFGIGFNYFFSRNVGLGLETRNIISKDEDSFNHVGLNLFVRFPGLLIDNFAPYVILGGGTRYHDHNITWRAWAGAGAEVRLHGNVGLFGDLRFVQKGVDDFADAGYVVRAGFRISL